VAQVIKDMQGSVFSPSYGEKNDELKKKQA
jgi:hypothetical protein